MTDGDEHVPAEFDASTNPVGTLSEIPLRDVDAFIRQDLYPISRAFAGVEGINSRSWSRNEAPADEI